MAMSWQDMMNYVQANKSLEDRFYTDEGFLSSGAGGGVYGYGDGEYGPLSSLLNANNYTYRTYDIPGVGRVQYDPQRQTFNQFESRNGSVGMYSPGSSGQGYTEISKDGTTQKQSVASNNLLDKLGSTLPVVAPGLMAALGGAAAMQAGAAGAGTAAGAAGAAEGAGGIGSMGGGMDWLSGLTNMFSGGGADGLLGKLGDFAMSKGGSALIGGLLGGSSSGPDNLTATSQSKTDPRLDPYIYGQNGILSQIMGQLNKQQSPGMQNFGSQMDAYLGQYGRPEFDNNMRATYGLRDSNIAAPQVQAPSQNNLDLSSAYDSMINGTPGANPYLTGAIQKGINQSNNAFGNMMTDATRNLTENILPSIRSGAIVNGQMGSSRQGIAEGRALNDYSTQMGRAMSQFGQNNTDAAVAAQAGAYNDDRNRALSAMTGLNGSQYQTALANAQLQADTNRLNSQNQAAGIGLSSGLLDKAYGYGTNQDAYDLSKIGKVSGLLGNYTGLNGSRTDSQPLYQNTAGNILGGATAGLGLWNAMNGGGGQTPGYATGMGTMSDMYKYGVF